MATTDRTKIETGDQQSERVGRTREPEISYDQNNRRLKPNDLGDRPAAEEDAVIDAQTKARGNRRDDRGGESVPSDLSETSGDEARSKRH